MVKPLTLSGFDSEKVSYGFFGRQGGVSDGIYGSLNCRNGSDDVSEHVAENRNRVCGAIGAAPERFLNLYQIHSDVVVIPDVPWGDARPEGDALVTDQPDMAIGILTADCGPVLFYGHKDNGDVVVGAAHAGWKGAIGGVLDNTVATMIERGAAADSIVAAVGPCIAKKSYEVSGEFLETFMKHDQENDRFFGSSQNQGHYMFDLTGYCASRLQMAGVSKVLLSDVDTYSNEDEYFSYRRTTHRGGGDYGGQVSVIMIKA